MLTIILTLFVCGAIANPTNTVLQPRIIGGHAAYNGQFPYQVSLRHANDGTHFCGGSIIGGFWILTSAHCVSNLVPREVKVIVGTNYLDSGGWTYSVSNINSHANFNPSNMVNDVALLRLSTQISAAPGVAIISLTSSETPSEERAVFSGWGHTIYPSGGFSNELQYIVLTTMSSDKCLELLPLHPIFGSHVCTHMATGHGACQGDSGSPLVLNGVQLGISSWGIPCATGNPDIFTSIRFYRSWIRTVSGI